MSSSDHEAPTTASDDLGLRLRSAREQAGLSMRALARMSGVSQPFLSMVEHGQSAPSLATLYRIAAALDIPPVALIPMPTSDSPGDAASSVTHVRHGEGRRLQVSEAKNSAVGTILSSHPKLEMVEYRVQAGEDLGGWFSSDGLQTLTVIEGRVHVELDGIGTWDLAAGDTLTHPSHVSHRWSADSQRKAHLVLAVAR